MDAERTIELSPQGSALIIVDMQAEGCERHGATLKPVIRSIRALPGPLSPGEWKNHPRSIGARQGPSRVHLLR